MPSVDVLLERDLPGNDLERLRRCCGENPPEFVLRDYWDYRRVRDRHDKSIMQPWELTALVFGAYKRCGQPIHDNPAKPCQVLKYTDDGRVKFGDYLRVHWRGMEHKGMFVEAHKAQKIVVVVLEGTERKVDANCILGPYIEQSEPASV